jgi:hypothetical protein
MTKKLREALDQIDELLLDPLLSRDLWDVLTALRGPDSENGVLKVLYTAPLRSAAFPRFCVPTCYCGEDTGFNRWSVQVGGELPSSAKVYPYSEHFFAHVRSALIAIERKKSEGE